GRSTRRAAVPARRRTPARAGASPGSGRNAPQWGSRAPARSFAGLLRRDEEPGDGFARPLRPVGEYLRIPLDEPDVPAVHLVTRRRENREDARTAGKRVLEEDADGPGRRGAVLEVNGRARGRRRDGLRDLPGRTRDPSAGGSMLVDPWSRAQVARDEEAQAGGEGEAARQEQERSDPARLLDHQAEEHDDRNGPEVVVAQEGSGLRRGLPHSRVDVRSPDGDDGIRAERQRDHGERRPS